jgi:hypothetical protein
MNVQVLEVIGGACNAPTLRVWGDSGALCRPYVNAFPAGTEWTFAVRKLDGGTPADYDISVYGPFLCAGGQRRRDWCVVSQESSRRTEQAGADATLAEFRARFRAAESRSAAPPARR